MEKPSICYIVFMLCFFNYGHTLPPTIHLSAKTAVVTETERNSVTLLDGDCSSDPPGKSCSLDIRTIYPSSPCGPCFDLLPCGLKFCLRFLPGQGTLNPAVAPRYTLTLVATDSDGNQALTAVDVHVQPNTPPYFDPTTYKDMYKNFGGFSSTGTYSVAATDEDGDAVTYSMTTVPVTSGIKIDSLSGEISVTRDLSYECRNSFSALVYAKDNFHTELSSPLAVTLDISNPNARPIINNLNTDLYLRETEAVGTVTLPLAVFDGSVDNPTTLTYSVSTVPVAAAGLLSVSAATNSIVVTKALDYETQPRTFTMTVQASDGFCSSEPRTLTVHLVDINEEPTLLPNDQTIESCEGLVDIKPYWNASDPDINDVIKFISITPNDQGRFKINKDTGVISTTIDYDLDVDKLAPTVIQTVTLSDRQGRTATSTVTILFQDCNDNAPYFKFPAKHYFVRDCWPAGTAVDNVPLADDLDSNFNQNDVISYSGSGAGVKVEPSGSMVLTKVFTAGETTTFPVYATDHGKVPGPLTSKAFYASVYCLPCIDTPPVVKTTAAPPVNTTVATIRPPNVASEEGNFVWFALAALLSTLLSALLLYFLWRYCWTRLRRCCARGNNCCKKERLPPKEDREPARRPTPPPDKQGPGFIFGWWKETYTNADYTKPPERDAIPDTSKGPEPVDTNTYDDDTVVPPTPPPPSSSSKPCAIL